MKKNKWIILSIVSIIIGLILLIAYVSKSTTLAKLEKLNYVKGELFRYEVQRKLLKKREFKNQLDIYLIGDETCYKGSSHFITTINEQKFYQVSYTGAPVEIGYIDTDDPLVKEMYDLKVEVLPTYDYYPYRYYYHYYYDYYDTYYYKKWQNDSIKHNASFQSIVNVNGIKQKVRNEQSAMLIFGCIFLGLFAVFLTVHFKKSK
jgi:hypothetical protein